MRFWDQWLRAWLIRYGGKLFQRLRRFVQEQALTEALRELEAGYRTAHRTGALWGLLDLLGERERIAPTEKALEDLAQKNGLYLSVTDSAVLGRLEAQIGAAQERFPAALTGDDTNDTAVSARVAGFAVRWAAQQGIADAAEGSTVYDASGVETELLKRWIRLAARHERRVWHDKLDGVTIPYKEKFRLESPRGVFLIDRPYDPALPLSEKIGCGHGIQLILPEEANSLTLFGASTTETQFTRRRKPPGLRVRLVGRSGPTPAGEPVSSRYEGLEGEMFAEARHGLAAIEKVHGISASTNRVTVQLDENNFWLEGNPAAYVPDERRPGRVRGIFLDPDGDYDALDFVHEVGHDLDHNLLGNGVQYASQASARLQAWREAALDSPTVRRQRQIYGSGRLEGKGLNPVEVQALEWMLDTREIFARSYAQWIGMNSGDSELLEQLGRHVDRDFRPVKLYTRTWPEDEFEPIAKALDELFARKGWTR